MARPSPGPPISPSSAEHRTFSSSRPSTSSRFSRAATELTWGSFQWRHLVRGVGQGYSLGWYVHSLRRTSACPDPFFAGVQPKNVIWVSKRRIFDRSQRAPPGYRLVQRRRDGRREQYCQRQLFRASRDDYRRRVGAFLSASRTEPNFSLFAESLSPDLSSLPSSSQVPLPPRSHLRLTEPSPRPLLVPQAPVSRLLRPFSLFLKHFRLVTDKVC